jgi:hypothetical protein
LDLSVSALAGALLVVDRVRASPSPLFRRSAFERSTFDSLDVVVRVVVEDRSAVGIARARVEFDCWFETAATGRSARSVRWRELVDGGRVIGCRLLSEDDRCAGAETDAALDERFTVRFGSPPAERETLSSESRRLSAARDEVGDDAWTGEPLRSTDRDEVVERPTARSRADGARAVFTVSAPWRSTAVR